MSAPPSSSAGIPRLLKTQVFSGISPGFSRDVCQPRSTPGLSFLNTYTTCLRTVQYSGVLPFRMLVSLVCYKDKSRFAWSLSNQMVQERGMASRVDKLALFCCNSQSIICDYTICL
jgi:hypothetical protein